MMSLRIWTRNLNPKCLCNLQKKNCVTWCLGRFSPKRLDLQSFLWYGIIKLYRGVIRIKKSILLLLLCAGILTGCGNDNLPAKPTETSTVSQITTAVQAADNEITTTTTAGIPEVIETCSDEIPSVTTVTETAAATEANPDNTESATTKASVQEKETSAVQNTTTKADDVVTTKITTPTNPIVTTKVTTNTKSTTPTKTTTKVTTTTPVTTTTKTEPEITDSNLYGYWYDISDRLDDPILDWTRMTFQIGGFIDEGIAYSDLYNIGKTFGGTDYEKAVAVCQYAYDLGGHSCIEYALNAYFLAKGAGIECYIARSAKYDWYGHVANIIKLDGEYYYMEPQGNIVGSPHTYAAGGNGISYPDGLDVVTDIYDSRVYVTL